MEYYKKVKKILIIILFLNFIVAIAKILFGLYSNTLSITTDGIHSSFDGISNIVGIVGLTFAAKPSDKEHPYGHYKIETLTSLIIVVLLFLAGYEVLTSAITKIYNPTIPDITFLSFLVMIITTLVNIGVSYYENKKGKELKSEFLIADSKHTRSDIYASCAIILGLIVMKLGYTIFHLIKNC
ncbi:MAG: cation diffusion facilitator family transporter [Methanobacteriaceae archaeon]|nr:cation diffusion facilitator family transporter [Methanobacteriaceae archaeon]